MDKKQKQIIADYLDYSLSEMVYNWVITYKGQDLAEHLRDKLKKRAIKMRI